MLRCRAPAKDRRAPTEFHLFMEPIMAFSRTKSRTTRTNRTARRTNTTRRVKRTTSKFNRFGKSTPKPTRKTATRTARKTTARKTTARKTTKRKTNSKKTATFWNFTPNFTTSYAKRFNRKAA